MAVSAIRVHNMPNSGYFNDSGEKRHQRALRNWKAQQSDYKQTAYKQPEYKQTAYKQPEYKQTASA